MIKDYFSFLVIPVHANHLDSGVLLVYSALFCCYSASFRYTNIFRYHSCLFRHSVLFQSHFALFRHIPVYSGIFRFICVVILVSFRLVSVYSGTILVHSGVILPHSGIFWFIPVYSVPFLFLVTPLGTPAVGSYSTTHQRISRGSIN